MDPNLPYPQLVPLPYEADHIADPSFNGMSNLVGTQHEVNGYQ